MFQSWVILLYVSDIETGLCSEIFLSKWPGSNILLLTGGNIFATVCLQVVFFLLFSVKQ